MSRKGIRPRAARRARERDTRKLARDLEALALREPGGAPDRPIEVVASPVIDVRARSMRCPLCGGSFNLDDHTAEPEGMRIVHVTCRQCATARRLFFRIIPAAN